MITEKFTLKSADGHELPSVIWKPDGDAVAVVQIIHGMTEHTGRYEGFAKYLTDRGIAVAGFDLRGHGMSSEGKCCASFGEDGWPRSIDDVSIFFKHLKNALQGKPVFMLGFSLGSFLLREYLGSTCEKPAGAIIMGTGHQPSFILSIIMSIVKSQIKKFGFDNTSPLIKTLSFDTYNKKFAPCRTDFDWLCANETELDRYMNDELCIKSISAGLFYDLLGSMKRTADKKIYNSYACDMPIFVISGANDPVGDFTKGTERMIKDMRGAGLKNISVSYIDGARHDVLHDGKGSLLESRYQDIIDWITNICEE